VIADGPAVLVLDHHNQRGNAATSSSNLWLLGPQSTQASRLDLPQSSPHRARIIGRCSNANELALTTTLASSAPGSSMPPNVMMVLPGKAAASSDLEPCLLQSHVLSSASNAAEWVGELGSMRGRFLQVRCDLLSSNLKHDTRAEHVLPPYLEIPQSLAAVAACYDVVPAAAWLRAQAVSNVEPSVAASGAQPPAPPRGAPTFVIGTSFMQLLLLEGPSTIRWCIRLPGAPSCV